MIGVCVCKWTCYHQNWNKEKRESNKNQNVKFRERWVLPFQKNERKMRERERKRWRTRVSEETKWREWRRFEGVRERRITWLISSDLWFGWHLFSTTFHFPHSLDFFFQIVNFFLKFSHSWKPLKFSHSWKRIMIFYFCLLFVFHSSESKSSPPQTPLLNFSSVY